jgi:outer membrane receptor protein involved in Fe transport
LKVDLDDNWTVLPQVMYQNTIAHGVFFENAELPPLQTVRFQNEVARDHFTQVALTIQGKIANFDLTYAGAYMDRPRYSTSDYTEYTDAYDAYYQSLGYQGILDYQNYSDNAGNQINPRQHIIGTDHFKKLSQEIRIASPADKPIRALVGAFYQNQKNHILQQYVVDNLATNLSVTGWPGLIWLTNQRRQDKDYAVFGEANWDITSHFTVTGGLRFYRYDNSLYGFAGFGLGNPGGFSTGENRCLTVNGLQRRRDPGSPLATGTSGLNIPCYDVADVVNGAAVPRRSKGSGHNHRLNAQWKPAPGLMFYATWSRGFRPGGINRQPNTLPYDADFLTNYEAGWKTTLLGSRLRWNGAVYHQIWKQFQFSFLGVNSLTQIQNGRDARINGIESDINYVDGGLTLTLTGAYTDAKTDGAICHSSLDASPTCSAPGDWIVTPSGTRLPVTPKLKGSATARYQWPLGRGKAHVQGVVAYQGSAAADIRQDIDGSGTNPNDFLGRIQASTTVDLFTGFDWGSYNAELFATNVFDVRNELSRFVVCSICTQTKIVVGRPRTIGLRVGTKF